MTKDLNDQEPDARLDSYIQQHDQVLHAKIQKHIDDFSNFTPEIEEQILALEQQMLAEEVDVQGCIPHNSY